MRKQKDEELQRAINQANTERLQLEQKLDQQDHDLKKRQEKILSLESKVLE